MPPAAEQNKRETTGRPPDGGRASDLSGGDQRRRTGVVWVAAGVGGPLPRGSCSARVTCAGGCPAGCSRLAEGERPVGGTPGEESRAGAVMTQQGALWQSSIAGFMTS
jgi:hypothetical protein